ncbi:adenylosuccinate synthetase, partial [Enterobacter sp. DRP3]|nr:adenylosuccinate synthetase [Enterobacter sp. DRP3]
MDTTLDSSVPAAKTGDAPRNLLGRPTTRHRGTDIDGATLDPEALRAAIGRMAELGLSVTPDNLSIAENATLVLPTHRAIDEAQERLRREPI